MTDRMNARVRRNYDTAEVEAMSRLEYAIATGDIAGGAQAMADAIDARVADRVYRELYPPCGCATLPDGFKPCAQHAGGISDGS